MVIEQVKTNQKSNEITAIPELLKLLDIRGGLVTIDPMGCQTKIAKNIVDQGGYYLLAVKVEIAKPSMRFYMQLEHTGQLKLNFIGSLIQYSMKDFSDQKINALLKYGDGKACCYELNNK